MTTATARFDAAQWAVLANDLKLADARTASADQCIDTRALLDVDQCRRVLDELGPRIGSDSRAITASLLAKRIAFLVTGPGLYALSAFDLGLNLALDNCVTDYRHDGAAWRSRMLLKDVVPTPPATPTLRLSADDREHLREGVVRRVFAGHLTPLWQIFQKASGIAPRILWENTAVRVYSLYERRLAAIDEPSRQRQIRDDFDYLLHRAPVDAFGLPDNPLARYYFDVETIAASDTAPTRQVRFRKTCCLYFKATCPAEYCSTCPLLR